MTFRPLFPARHRARLPYLLSYQMHPMHQRFCLITLFCFGPTAFAGEVRVSLDQLPAHAVAHSPELRAARLRIEEAGGVFLGSGRLANPEIGLALSSGSRFREGTLEVTLDQRFPITARLRLEKALSSHLIEAAELEVRDAERKLIVEVQILAIQLLAMEAQLELSERQSELALKLSQFAAERSTTGEISPLDAAQAMVNSQRLLLEGRRLSTERLSLLGELKVKVGMEPRDTIMLTGSLPAPIPPDRGDWEQRADYRLAKLNEEATRTEVELARSRKWQDIAAGFLWEGERMEDAPDGLQDTGFVGLRLSVPLPVWNRNQGEITEKEAKAKRAVLETEALQTRIENEAATALNLMEANARLASETKEGMLPLVIEQTERMEQAYQRGQTDLLAVLRAREQRLALESATLNATRDFHLARVRYEAAIGIHAPALAK